MTSSRSQQPPLSVRLPSAGGSVLSELPPLSALFLIDFDVRAGYTIAWKRAEDGIELEGLVEYKSLPSGLHTVDDDLIYFIHEGGYAGLSAFVNTPCEEEDARNARMIAVGILVPLSEGRLGRAWRHAELLKDMAAYGPFSLPFRNCINADICVGKLHKTAHKPNCWRRTGRNTGDNRLMAKVLQQTHRWTLSYCPRKPRG